jgi:hypothetical protein
MHNPNSNFAFVDNGDGSSHVEPIVTVDMAQEIDSTEEILREILQERIGALTEREVKIICFIVNHFKSQEQKDLTWFIAWVLDDVNPILKIWSAAFAFNMEVTEGMSQNQKALELGVGRAAMSKRVKNLSNEYGAISRSMRSAPACESYRQDKLMNHFRYQEQIRNAKNEYHQNKNRKPDGN